MMQQYKTCGEMEAPRDGYATMVGLTLDLYGARFRGHLAKAARQELEGKARIPIVGTMSSQTSWRGQRQSVRWKVL